MSFLEDWKRGKWLSGFIKIIQPQLGQRQRFSQRGSSKPSKSLETNPCPHTLARLHLGHFDGRSQGNFLPCSKISLSTTATNCIIFLFLLGENPYFKADKSCNSFRLFFFIKKGPDQGPFNLTNFQNGQFILKILASII